jgi:putative ABC transport system permease protein
VAEALETPWLTVVGVAGDVRHDGIVNPPGFDLYVPYTQYYAGDTYFIVRTDLPAEHLVPSIETAIRRVDREQSVFAIRPFSAYLDDVSWQQRLSVRLFGLFAVLTLGLATMGTYALMSHLTTERRHELAVRSALGADRASLVWLVLRRAVVLTGCGCAIGLVVAAGLTQWMSWILTSADRDAPAVIVAAALVIAACSAAASWVPAHRAAATDPRRVL